jgi:uncharacterized membrane protein YoaK (UPF0700 family)
MINKLPKWVEVGGLFLAFIAGFVNAVALLGFNHQGVSHLTGSSTLLGVELAQTNYLEVIHLILIIVSFVIGAGASGFVIGNESLKLGRRYSAALFAEAILLVLAMHYLVRGSNLGQYLASAACGLQNAMTSTFSGAVVRTTHLTGLFTDLGITIGLWFRGQTMDKRRCALYATLIFGFIFGGVTGALSFKNHGFYSIIIPALLSIVIGAAYLLYWRKTKVVLEK